MEEGKIVAILSALANGVNPVTGEVFPADSPYQQTEVVRALYAALERLKAAQPAAVAKPRPRGDMPSNVGKPWSEDEDRRLLTEFDRGRKPAELARELGRTLAGIEARLEKLGRLSASERKTVNRYPRENAAMG
jgi:hypothetical protein